MVEGSRHAVIGHFLRTRRMRTTPRSVGLPENDRRRGMGLRRDEVAQLANVSPTWYAYLEQGRRINPSLEVLDALATALRMTPVERRYLHGVASGWSTRTDPHADDVALELVESLVTRTDSTPYPAYAVTATGDLICWNRHMSEWYGDFPGDGLRHHNLVWWMFTTAAARQRIVGWESVAREMVARVRFTVGTQGLSPRLATMLDELRTTSPAFATHWDEHDVTDRSARRRSFARPDGGRSDLRLMALQPAASPSALVVLHFAG